MSHSSASRFLLTALAGACVLTGTAKRSWADDAPAPSAAPDGQAPNDATLADQVRALQQRVDQLTQQLTMSERLTS